MTFDEITRCLSITDQKIIGDMLALFDGIDRQTEKFAGQTGLKCKNGCGACCTNPDIETTITEVLPLAAYLWSKDIAQNKLEVIRGNANKDICVFYEPDPLVPTQGRCGIYAYRPGLCRLFGFAARKDKHGQRTLVTCKVIKESQPQVCQRVQEDLHKDLEVPLLATHAFSVANIDPVHGQKLLPINQAISLGLEKIGVMVEKLKH
jgi:uncharacterized protein